MSIGPSAYVLSQTPNNAASVVTAGFLSQHSAANSSLSTAYGYLRDMKALVNETGLFNVTMPDAQLGELVNAIHAIIYPERPALAAIDTAFPALPDSPTLLPVGSMALPNPPSSDMPADPRALFAYTEELYVSSLFDSLNATLKAWIDGSHTGIDPGVEAQIYQRMRDRNAVNTRAKLRAARRAWSAGGWDKPGGILAKAEREIQREAIAQNAEDARTVAVNSADLEQKNRQFALTTGQQHEAARLTYATAANQRLFDARKYTSEENLEIFKAVIARVEAGLRAYGALAEAVLKRFEMEIKVNQEIPLEEYKVRAGVVTALTDAIARRIAAVASMNESSIKMYSSEIQAEATRVGAEADAVKAEVEVLTAKANIAIESFKAQVQKITAQAGLEADIAKAIGQLGAQLAASIWSSVSLQASVSDTYNASNHSSGSLEGRISHSTEYNADK